MKIERILYGMQTENGKILTKYTDGVIHLLQPKSRDKIRSLTVDANRKPLYFPTEQVLAYPVIIEVTDKDPTHGGRTYVQSQTFLIKPLELLDYITNNGCNPLDKLTLPELDKFPESFDPINL